MGMMWDSGIVANVPPGMLRLSNAKNNIIKKSRKRKDGKKTSGKHQPPFHYNSTNFHLENMKMNKKDEKYI